MWWLWALVCRPEIISKFTWMSTTRCWIKNKIKLQVFFCLKWHNHPEFNQIDRRICEPLHLTHTHTHTVHSLFVAQQASLMWLTNPLQLTNHRMPIHLQSMWVSAAKIESLQKLINFSFMSKWTPPSRHACCSHPRTVLPIFQQVQAAWHCRPHPHPHPHVLLLLVRRVAVDLTLF